jgi:hypothetical protein
MLAVLARRLLSASRGTSRGLNGVRRVSTTSSVVPSKPIYYHSLGILKVLTVSAPFIYVGAFIAKSFAAYLEDFDLFVPDDDDE